LDGFEDDDDDHGRGTQRPTLPNSVGQVVIVMMTTCVANSLFLHSRRGCYGRAFGMAGRRSVVVEEVEDERSTQYTTPLRQHSAVDTKQQQATSNKQQHGVAKSKEISNLPYQLLSPSGS
jgi:hypothetical protein